MDDIVTKERDKVAYRLWLKFVAEEISTEQLLGAIFYFDEQIHKAYGHIGEKATQRFIFEDVPRVLPGVAVLDFFGNQLPYLGVPDKLAQNKELTTYEDVKTAAILSYVGAETGRNYAGSKCGVEVQALINAGITAAWLIYTYNCCHTTGKNPYIIIDDTGHGGHGEIGAKILAK
jgi:hypothetical protein